MHYSSFTYARKIFLQLCVAVSLPMLMASGIFFFLRQKPSGYISSAKVQITQAKLSTKVKHETPSFQKLYSQRSDLALQLGAQLQNPGLLHVLACKLSAYDLHDPQILQDFQSDTGIKGQEAMDFLSQKLNSVSWHPEDSLESFELDSLISLCLDKLGNDVSYFSYKIHHQWIPNTDQVYIKAYDAHKARANFIVRTLCEVLIDYQKEIEGKKIEEVIASQKLLIREKKNDWEGSKERIRSAQNELSSGRGPKPIRDLKRRTLVLKKSLNRLQERIQDLKRKLQDRILDRKREGHIITVSYEQEAPEDLLRQINTYLNESRLISTELKTLQEKLMQYEEKHLRTLMDQEKRHRTAFLEAQSRLQNLLSDDYASLGEIKLLEPAHTVDPNMNSAWILATFSFFASLSLWLIFLLRLRKVT